MERQTAVCRDHPELDLARLDAPQQHVVLARDVQGRDRLGLRLTLLDLVLLREDLDFGRPVVLEGLDDVLRDIGALDDERRLRALTTRLELGSAEVVLAEGSDKPLLE